MNPLKILFICTHNRCRSILAEAVANQFNQSLIVAASAGSEPASEIHPATLDALARHQISGKGLYSKSWDELEDFDADFVITVCDNAAQEKCPLWFGMSLKVHWGLSDPSINVEGETHTLEAFDQTINILKKRIAKLVVLLEKDPGRTAVLTLLESLADQK